MPALRVVREALLEAHFNRVIDDEEFLLLYDMNYSKNLDYPYWNYRRFDLDNLSNEECWSEFRFNRNDIYELREIFHIPEEIITYNRLKVNGIEALCIFLKRFAYPCRYSDFIPRFGRPVPQYSIISNQILNLMYENWHHLLENFNQPWLSPRNLEQFCNVIHEKGAALDNCWGFVDGTVRPISRPGRNQRAVYNGHKKVHALKFQSIAAPNGLIANLYGPVEGRRHDSAMLAQSQIYPQLQQHLCRYNWTISLHLWGSCLSFKASTSGHPFRNAILTQQQKQYNTSMSQVRTSVEWLFGDITNWFAFIDFKKKS